MKGPLETADLTNRAALDAAISEAKTRLVTVENRQLRADLSTDIDDAYARALAVIQEREQQERALIEAEARRRLELEQQTALAALAARKKAEAEAERKIRRATTSKTPGEGNLDQMSRRHAAEEAQHSRAKEAITDLVVAARDSVMGDGTKVLIIRNEKGYAVDVELRCYTGDHRTKGIRSITVPARGEKHLGFLQGWCGNFKSGERCEAYLGGELMWKYTVP